MSKVRKALAGGAAAAFTAGTAFVWGKGSVQEQLIGLAAVVIPAFVIGFCTVYLAPANKTN